MSSKQKQTSTATTTPNVPDWIAGPYKGFATKIEEMMGRDPKSFVAGPSGLQQKAFDAAGGLLDQSAWKDILGASGAMALAGASAAPNLAQPVTMPGAATAAGVPALPEVAMASGGGIADPGAAQAGRVVAAQLDPAHGYSAERFDPETAAALERSLVGPMAQATSGSLLDADLSRYANPYLDEVVNATDEDLRAQEAQKLAAIQAEMMGSGAIRGSGRAVREGILAGEMARARAAELGKLRSEGWEKARQFATTDLDRAAKTSEFNAGEQNEGAIAQAELDSARNLKGGELTLQGLIANQQAENEARGFTAGAENERNLTQGKLATDAGIATAGNETQASIATLDARTRAAIAGADNATKVALANAQSVNDRANLLASLGVDVSKFNASQVNEMAKFVAGEQGQTARFNAGQMDKTADRQLDAAGVLGNLASIYGSNSRGDLQLVGDLGSQQREIEQALKGADPAMLSLLGQWLGAIPTDDFSSKTTTGKSVTKSAPGLTELAQLGMSAAYLFSDERTKRDVKTAGYDDKGRRWVDFAYHWDEPGTRRRGVIAQEVAQTDPHAVGVHSSGLLGVDYGKLR